MSTEEKPFGQQQRDLLVAANQLKTVKQFSNANPAFTEPAVRNLIWKAETRPSSRGEIKGNGLLESGAVIRIGRRILIDEQAFFAWVRGNAAVPAQGNGVGASSR